MGLEDSGYIGLALEILTNAGVKIGDIITVINSDHKYSGILMPRASIGSDPNHIVVKLDNGYNIGICLSSDTIIERDMRVTGERTPSVVSLETNPELPTVSILSTGGTIASKVDYQTGAVNPALSAQDLYDTIPELQDYANISAQIVMSKLSENISPSDWTKIAKRVATHIRDGVDGVVVAHGTDTLGYTGAALSFALQNLPVPVAFVGSQRSSDRPSSDAALNLIRATDFVGRSNIAEVLIVMHGETDDSFAFAHRAVRTRKCHTSRRDAFQSINSSPLFKINEDSFMELSSPLYRRDLGRKLKVKANFEEKVTLVKIHPGLRPSLIDYLVSEGYRGIVLEGSGLGHASKKLQESLSSAVDSGLLVAMTSQCINGRVNMNVYRSGVELLERGVIPCEDMIAETALVKMMWLLGNTKKLEKAKDLMTTNLVGEIGLRSEYKEYHYSLEGGVVE
ncbi:MAG: Glutamyl-tRNA(Gln) amidotransferase subunit D [Candidatus Thorarchaeota archaeon]|nr:MAG: Glutamyl-tRNA(Gln) amidotransferase subunit D [Candidatus Thorarchaeota archaeon]